MVKKRKCRACGFKFRLEKENRYLVRKSTSLIGNMTERPTTFEMFDCPQCGCQNPLGTYMQPIEET
jgi:hypothetical protein